ncbi:MAG: class II D-tagatose-bisphosphate aldolase, non-catalytic subunit [Chloroflexota bacterium]
MNPTGRAAFFDEIIRSHERVGVERPASSPLGIVSICSAHPWVLQAAMRQLAGLGTPLLVESTCNQVNQFGGYTGMTPEDFVRFVYNLAGQVGFPQELILLGGDHLGPFVWQDEPAERAMHKSLELVSAYVRAGYVKIHLDASMKLADDPPGALPVEVSARRAAELAGASEAAWAEKRQAGQPAIAAPRYVIGTEVPVAGGAKAGGEAVSVTSLPSLIETIEATRQAFCQAGLEAAWERVVAVVVQPGVEYGDDYVLNFQPEAACQLASFIETQPHLVYEAHSTDYQTPQALRALVENHFAILKVGPGLTFAFREAVFALAWMEAEWLGNRAGVQLSHLPEVLDTVMQADPKDWRKYYRGDEQALRFARKYSFSDRSRYYWPYPQVRDALETLFKNLERYPAPLALLSQFMPEQYAHLRAGKLSNQPREWVYDRVSGVLAGYLQATSQAFGPACDQVYLSV